MFNNNVRLACVKCSSKNTCCNIIDIKYENRKFKCKTLCHDCKFVSTEHIICPTTPKDSNNHISASTPIKDRIPTFSVY